MSENISFTGRRDQSMPPGYRFKFLLNEIAGEAFEGIMEQSAVARATEKGGIGLLSDFLHTTHDPRQDEILQSMHTVCDMYNQSDRQTIYLNPGAARVERTLDNAQKITVGLSMDKIMKAAIRSVKPTDRLMRSARVIPAFIMLSPESALYPDEDVIKQLKSRYARSALSNSVSSMSVVRSNIPAIELPDGR